MSEIRSVQVTRYVTPLREGGSLPAIAEADDGFLYVLKFRGAGQGVKALVAELVGGEVARSLQLKVPELVLAHLDEAFGRTEGDEEIQDLLKASQGLNLGLHYLSGSLTFDPAVTTVDPLLASKIVWLDAFLTNMDRTVRNTNMLMWHNELWLIDHGACLYFHHNWNSWREQMKNPFPLIKDHVLLKHASKLEEADAFCRSALNEQLLHTIVNSIPMEWLAYEEAYGDPEAAREVYFQFLNWRLKNSFTFLKTALDARAVGV
ncbi:aminotransferase class I and II [Niabella ginsenosidivorans]|uniref:Aminotransferase class I and II n=1 Tax=Niabella ginsenosidivorans TaxID=1176587 RepID=A0A1A9I2Z1_9BACT|nr:HipA family kinase [Niabella ginsenosidivorans]ANH82037.1 aminotransferase class I and II [Niabella ginsenosidivorans]